MIIHRMTACFGALENQTLELSDGFNILTAPNESGKSTWCAFLRVMLYGLNTSEREKQGAKPDKVKYAPWSGLPMSGSMDLSWNGREITLRRWTERTNQPMQAFAAVYTGTEEPVPELRGDDAGEKLTGVSRAVFERSAFIRQGGLGFANTAELEKRINALVTTGEEEVSFSETDKRLRAWQRQRTGRAGTAQKLDAQIARQTELLRQIREDSDAALSLGGELADARAERDDVSARMVTARAEQRKAALAQLTRVNDAVRQAAARLDESGAELARREAALEASVFAKQDPAQAREQADGVRREAGALEQRGRRMPPLWTAFVALGLSGVCVGLSGLRSVPLLALAGALLLAAGLLFWRLSAVKKTVLKARADRTALLARYGAADEAALTAALDAHLALWDGRTAAERALQDARRELEQLQAAQQTANRALMADLDFAAGDTEAARLGRRVEALERRINDVSLRRAQAEGRIRALGDPLVITSELAALRLQREAVAGEDAALGLAIETLAAADAQLQSRFSPQLSRRAAKLFAKLTDGRYDELTLAKDLSARARLAGQTVGREADYLSGGAADQLYLALRLAVCELALDGDETCPMVLDDALVNFDEARMERALTLLRELSDTRQVLLFTCHGRETKFFADDPAVRTGTLADGKAQEYEK